MPSDVRLSSNTTLAKRNLQFPPSRQMQFRIGIHVGEVISKEGSLYGDGVNIAARLEALALPGGVCISGTVHDHIRDKLAVPCDDVGEQKLKNIARRVHVWRVRMDKAPVTTQLALRSRRTLIIAASLSMIARP